MNSLKANKFGTGTGQSIYMSSARRTTLAHVWKPDYNLWAWLPPPLASFLLFQRGRPSSVRQNPSLTSCSICKRAAATVHHSVNKEPNQTGGVWQPTSAWHPGSVGYHHHSEQGPSCLKAKPQLSIEHKHRDFLFCTKCSAVKTSARDKSATVSFAESRENSPRTRKLACWFILSGVPLI